jgi:hypothetical protein
MAKIQIKDLPEDTKISAAELTRIRGGTAYARLSPSLFKSYSPNMVIGDFGLPYLAPSSYFGLVAPSGAQEGKMLKWFK